MEPRNTAFLVLELRMLQQRRAECTDGRNLLRVLAGAITAIALSLLAAKFQQHDPEVSPVNVAELLAICLACIGASVWWIERSDKHCTEQRIAELQTALSTEQS